MLKTLTEIAIDYDIDKDKLYRWVRRKSIHHKGFKMLTIKNKHIAKTYDLDEIREKVIKPMWAVGKFSEFDEIGVEYVKNQYKEVDILDVRLNWLALGHAIVGKGEAGDFIKALNYACKAERLVAKAKGSVNGRRKYKRGLKSYGRSFIV